MAERLGIPGLSSFKLYLIITKTVAGTDLNPDKEQARMEQQSMTYNERDIILGIRQGDRTAMKALYSRHVRYLTAVCSRYVLHAEDVRDVLQNAFLKIFSSVGDFEYRGEGSVRGWMARIVLNETLKFIKADGRLTFVSLDEDNMDVAEEMPDIDGLPARMIHEAIRELPAGYRTVFNLYVMEGRSHKDIARELNISESTSASQLHRAKSMLAKKLRQLKTPE